MNVVKTIVGWVLPLVILGAGIAVFLGLGKQPPPVRTPAQAAQALREGARAVTVGSAITRVEHITSWFAQAVSRPGSDAGS
jgi:hypothetical protein